MAFRKLCKAKQIDICEKEIEEYATQEGEVMFKCTARGFHECKKIWNPKKNQILKVKFENNNVCDPYSIGLYTRLQGKIELVIYLGRFHDFANFTWNTKESLCQYFVTPTSIDLPFPKGVWILQ